MGRATSLAGSLARPQLAGALSGDLGANAISLRTNLIEWWNLNEASGTRTGSHAGITLTDTGGSVSAAGAFSGSGNSASFVRASTQQLSTTNSQILNAFLSSFSVAGWYRVNDILTENDWFFVQEAPGNHLIGCRSQSGALRASCTSDALAVDGSTNAGVPSVTAATWEHFCVTRTPTQTKLYKNGVLGATVDASFTRSSAIGTFYIGARPETVQYLNGRVDELAVWSRALSDAEVASLYNAGNGLLYTQI